MVERHRGRYGLHTVAILGVALALSTALAFGLPATYVSEASVQISEPPAAKPGPKRLPPAGESAERLEDALLTRTQLDKLSKGAPKRLSEQDLAALRAGSQILATGPNTFVVSVKAGSSQQAQYFASQLAKLIVERAPRILVTTTDKAKAETLLDQRLRELANFVSAHPEVSAEEPGAAPTKDSATRDSTMRLLRYEKERVETQLQRLATRPTASDNPYAEPGEDPAVLRRRLADLKAAIQMREAALSKPPDSGAPVVTPAPTPELLAEWNKKLKAVSEAQNTRDQSDPTLDPAAVLLARVIAEATLPKSPLTPNRPLVILLGLFSGTLVASALWVSRVYFQRPVSARDEEDYEATQPGPESPSTAPPPEHPSPIPAPSPIPSPPPPAPEPPPEQQRRVFWHGFQPQAQPQPRAEVLTTADEAPAPRLLPASTSSNGERRESLRDDQTPPQSFSVRRAGRSGAHKGATEVNVQAPDEQRTYRRAPITQALGSMVPPDVTENSNAKMQRSNTTYSYSSTPPPPDTALAPTQELPPVSHSKLIACYDVPAGWRPDPSLLPLNSFATLRDTMYQLALGRSYVALVTSAPEHRHAKSRTAAQLALALAETGHPRVLLVEADFDRPQVSRVLHIDMPPGLGFSQQLHGRIRPDADPVWSVVRCVPTLHILGETNVRTPGMLLSVQFETAITELRRHYDLIVIDAPLTNLPMDIRALDSVVDGVVIAAAGGAAGVARAEHSLLLFSEKSLRAIVPTDASGPIL